MKEEYRGKNILQSFLGFVLETLKKENVKERPIVSWNKPTSILYGAKDNLCEADEIISFVKSFNCDLKVMEYIRKRKLCPFNSGKMVYLCGVLAEEVKNIPENMSYYNIQRGLYAVFTTPSVNMRKEGDSFAQMIKSTWRYIFNEWFENSDYAYDEERCDFEFYDERCHFLKNSVMDIYIPIK